jgi:hypothetical protein
LYLQPKPLYYNVHEGLKNWQTFAQWRIQTTVCWFQIMLFEFTALWDLRENSVQNTTVSDIVICYFISKNISHGFFLLLIVFYSGMYASFTEILFILHSHVFCRPSGDCGGSRDRTRDCCVTAWFQLVDLTTELPHPHWATTSSWKFCTKYNSIRYSNLLFHIKKYFPWFFFYY